MKCDQFRRIAGASPWELGLAGQLHRLMCRGCDRFLARMRHFDSLLLRALKIAAPDNRGGHAAGDAARPSSGAMRYLRLALVMVAVAAVMVVVIIAQSIQTSRIADAVLAHVQAEPAALAATGPVSGESLLHTLATTGFEIDPGSLEVRSAELCEIRGHTIAHLVLSSAAGPMTLLWLPQERLARALELDANGYRGRIVPLVPGSLAVLADATQPADRIEAAFTVALASVRPTE